MTSSRYLQARLYPDAEWGWVDVGYGVSSSEATATMCNHVISNSGDATLTKSFLRVSYCPSSATSFTECFVEYTNGIAVQYQYYCPAAYAPDSSTGGTVSEIMGLAIGIPLGVAIVAVVCICICRKRNSSEAFEGEAPNGEPHAGIEMTTVHHPVPLQPFMATDFSTQSTARSSNIRGALDEDGLAGWSPPYAWTTDSDLPGRTQMQPVTGVVCVDPPVCLPPFAIRGGTHQ